MKGCVILLDRNEIDFIPDAPVITYQIMAETNVPKDHFKFFSPTIQKSDLRLMITKKKNDSQGNSVADFLKKFNTALTKLKADGTIQKMGDNY